MTHEAEVNQGYWQQTCLAYPLFSNPPTPLFCESILAISQNERRWGTVAFILLNTSMHASVIHKKGVMNRCVFFVEHQRGKVASACLVHLCNCLHRFYLSFAIELQVSYHSAVYTYVISIALSNELLISRLFFFFLFLFLKPCFAHCWTWCKSLRGTL